MSLKCIRCDTVWPDELELEWGQTMESSGYGPRPVCVALVEARNGSLEVCRGSLGHTNKKATVELHAIGELHPSHLRPPTPNEED